MVDWPQKLIKDFARKRAIVIIGSGVSRHAVGTAGVRPPTWREFLTKAVTDCPNRKNLGSITEALSSNDLLHACEWLKKRYDDSWTDYLRNTFSQPAFAPAEIHQEIYRLDCRILFSLNFDDIYERHANSVSHGSHVVKNFYDLDVGEFLRGDGRYIIKVHGNLHSPEHLIFPQQDYSRARSKYSSFYQAFDAALLTHTFVFIGSGYSDPDVNLLLENHRFDFPTQSPHYFIGAQGMNSDRQNSLRTNRNLKVIEYDPVDMHHAGLVRELQALNGLVETEVHDMAASASW